MPDRSDATVLTYRSRGSARRMVFEPRSDGRYDFIEETLMNGGDWRPVGEDVVDTIAVEHPEEN